MTPEREPGLEPDRAPDEKDVPAPSPPQRGWVRVPALVVIALYMFLLAGINVVSVAKGVTRPAFLIFSAAFFCAAMGLLLLFRWAWTLTLAAVVVLSGLFFYRFSTQHDLASLMQGGLNLVIFFYLVRPEVRANLR
jgi:hypothetical protein